MQPISYSDLVQQLGDYKLAAFYLWLDEEVKKESSNARSEMLAAIRNEISRFADLQQRYFKRDKIANQIFELLNREYWNA